VAVGLGGAPPGCAGAGAGADAGAGAPADCRAVITVAGSIIAAHDTATQPPLIDQTHLGILINYHPVEASAFVCVSYESYADRQGPSEINAVELNAGT
jgi:hypothetical protein